MISDGTREGTLDVTEQFRGEQLGGQRGVVDGAKRFARSCPTPCHRTCRADAPTFRVHAPPERRRVALDETIGKLINAKSHTASSLLGKPDTANNSHEAPRWRCLGGVRKHTGGGGRATTSTNVLKSSGTQTVATPLVVVAAWPPPPEPHKNHLRPPSPEKNARRADRSPALRQVAPTANGVHSGAVLR